MGILDSPSHSAGVGLNALNAAPTTSLNQLVPSHLQSFTLEKLLARILTLFEEYYQRFLESGFSGHFEDMYYRHWLHRYGWHQFTSRECPPNVC